MARWKLMTGHYLNTIRQAEWQYTEIDRRGDPIRRTFHVPRFLDPSDPKSWTNRWGTVQDPEGEVIVCLPGTGQPSDWEFIGDPTPDMMPVDDEAREISASFAERWAYKPEGAEVSYSQSMIDRFETQQAETQSQPAKVEIDGLAELVAAITAQSTMLSQLISASITNSQPRRP